MADRATIEAIGLPPAEAIAYLRQKTNQTTRRWTDVFGAANARAFAVAGAATDALVADFRREVARALETGTSLADFRKSFDAIVEKHGWAHTGTPGRRAAIIYETNLSTAYSAGRYAQMTEPATLEAFPWWQYVHSGATHPRINHLNWNGKVLAASDPWWTTHYPPNGWRCGCRVRPLSDRGLTRTGRTGPDQAPPSNPRPWRNPSTGGIEMVPEGIDPGFAHNPGEEWLGRGRVEGLRPRAPLVAEAVPAPASPATTRDASRPAPLPTQTDDRLVTLRIPGEPPRPDLPLPSASAPRAEADDGATRRMLTDRLRASGAELRGDEAEVPLGRLRSRARKAEREALRGAGRASAAAPEDGLVTIRLGDGPAPVGDVDGPFGTVAERRAGLITRLRELGVPVAPDEGAVDLERLRYRLRGAEADARRAARPGGRRAAETTRDRGPVPVPQRPDDPAPPPPRPPAAIAAAMGPLVRREVKLSVLDRWLRDDFSSWAAGLSGDEAAALATYKSGFYGQFRAALDDPTHPLHPEATRLRRALDRAELRRPVKAFRGVGQVEWDAMPREEGASFALPGLTSSSLSVNVAMEYPRPPDARVGMMEMRLPAPFRGAAYVDPFPTQTHRLRELLLTPGTRLRVLSSRSGRIVVEGIADDPSGPPRPPV